MQYLKISWLILVSLWLWSCGSPSSKALVEKKPTYHLPSVAKPQKVWNVAFLIMDGVYNTELTAPMDILHHTIYHTAKGMRVFTVAKSLDPVTSFEGLKIIPDHSYRDDSFSKIDVLVIPSAEHHLDSDLEDEEMIAFVQKAGTQAHYLMSLCDGAFVLAEAGLLKNLACTTFPGDIAAFKEMFPELDVHQDVLFVHDGKAITSAGGARSFEPALYLVELLYGLKAAQGIAKGMVIDWDLSQLSYVGPTNDL